MKRKILSLVLCLVLVLALCPMASADDIIGIDKVNIETYPSSKATYNDLPTVGQQVSEFRASTITAGISVTGCSLVDDNGVTCTGMVENKNYTLYVTVVSQASNYIFTGNTKAYINNVAASISPNGDGTSATISRYIKPNVVDPVIYKNPTDENHDKSSVFSFTASASQVYTSFQWYIMSTYGEKFTPEELSAAYPGVTTSVKDMGSSGVRLNIGDPLDEMSGWLVYCTFTGYSGVPVATSKATMTIKGVTPSNATPTPIIVDLEDEDSDVPEGITIVETPTPSIQIVETPSPTIEIVETPAPTTVPTAEVEVSTVEDASASAAAKTKDNSKLMNILKWVGIGIGVLALIGVAVFVIPYFVQKSKDNRRRKMSGRGGRRH